MQDAKSVGNGIQPKRRVHQQYFERGGTEMKRMADPQCSIKIPRDRTHIPQAMSGARLVVSYSTSVQTSASGPADETQMPLLCTYRYTTLRAHAFAGLVSC
jgi:hypothetical protein